MVDQMTQTKEISTNEPYLIDPATRLGHVHYTVKDLERQIRFFCEILGFQVHWRQGRQAGLGAGGEDLLRMTEDPGARRIPGTTGMYHFALVYPTRKDLARAIARLIDLRYPNYPTDHIFTKTTYLDDPEGNNIELYVYSLEDGTIEVENGNYYARRSDGTLSNGREPLDLEALFSELEPGAKLDLPLPKGTQIGHVHMYGSSLEKQMQFYRDVLGFQQGMLATRMRMADVQLDRPHVIAFNTWQGEGAPPAPQGSLGIRYYTILLPTRQELEEVIERIHGAGIELNKREDGFDILDPAGIHILLKVDHENQS